MQLDQVCPACREVYQMPTGSECRAQKSSTRNESYSGIEGSFGTAKKEASDNNPSI
ncbi:hypothetical protein BDR07DRAFT_1442060, partial [Suillus spraguei]